MKLTIIDNDTFRAMHRKNVQSLVVIQGLVRHRPSFFLRTYRCSSLLYSIFHGKTYTKLEKLLIAIPLLKFIDCEDDVQILRACTLYLLHVNFIEMKIYAHVPDDLISVK